MAFTTISGADYGADTAFIGTSSVDTIAIVGLAGSAYLEGDADNDIVIVTNFKNTVSDYTLKGGQGNDSITVEVVALTDSFIAGNSGNDTIFAIDVTASTLQGGQGNDVISTRDLTSTLVAGNLGTDVLSAIDVQASSVWGGQGNDAINIGTDGNLATMIGASIEGNLGNDVIAISASTFISSTVSGGLGNDIINASLSTDGVVLFGNEGNDALAGGSGEDTIEGADGDDFIEGNAGADSLLGGAGNDTIVGGANADNLFGGEGADTFTGTAAQTFSGLTFTSTSTIDTITDWSSTDKLSFSAGTTLAIGDTYATLGDAITAMTTAGSMVVTDEYEIVAVGSGTSYTAVLFINDGADTDADGAIQLGTTGFYSTAAAAKLAIAAAQIV